MRGADQCNVITLHWSTSIRLSRRMTAWFRQPITLVRSNNRAAGQTSGDGQPGGAASSKISKAPSAPIDLVRTDLRQCHCGSVPKLVGVVCQIVPRFEIRPPDVLNPSVWDLNARKRRESVKSFGPRWQRKRSRRTRQRATRQIEPLQSRKGRD